MPRYHFNIYDESSHIDVDGVDLSDLQTARSEGLRAFGAMVADSVTQAIVVDEWRLEITDAAGLMLFRMDFAVIEAPAVETTGVLN